MFDVSPEPRVHRLNESSESKKVVCTTTTHLFWAVHVEPESMLEVLTDNLECFIRWHGMGVHSTFQDNAWIGLDDVRGVDVDVET